MSQIEGWLITRVSSSSMWSNMVYHPICVSANCRGKGDEESMPLLFQGYKHQKLQTSHHFYSFHWPNLSHMTKYKCPKAGKQFLFRVAKCEKK